MKLQNYILVLFISSHLLSCSQSAEEFGKKLAAKDCECRTLARRNEIEITKQILAEIKSGKITTEQAMNQRGVQLSADPKYGDNSKEVGLCWKEFRELSEGKDIKFVTPEERGTLDNTFNSNRSMCIKQLDKEIGVYRDEARKAMNLPTEWDAAYEKMKADSIAIVRANDSMNNAMKKIK